MLRPCSLKLPALLLLLVPGGCAPDPIPPDASFDVTLKNGVVWYWQDEVAGGCIDWMAKPDWFVSTTVMVGPGCVERGTPTYRESKGVRYSSTYDELTVFGYWPWSPEIRHELIVFDDEGNWVESLPCPQILTAPQLEAIALVVTSGLEQHLTDRERLVLEGVSQRLAESDGTGLASAQFGCQIESADPAWQDFRTRPNHWTDE